MIRKLISRSTGVAAKIPIPKFLRGSIYGTYAKRYGVRLDEAEKLFTEYRSMDDFFTRKLRAGLRLVDSDTRSMVSPVDGTVSACGKIEGETIFQAKGLDYSLSELFARDPRAQNFLGGNFLTIYLAPGDCHRIFAPLQMKILETKRIGGTLRPVRTKSVESVPKLFCRNERVIFYLDTPLGQMVLIMVGALNVGSIEVLRPLQKQIAKAEDFAAFHLGSTVILVTPAGKLNWEPLQVGQKIQIGRKIGTFQEL